MVGSTAAVDARDNTATTYTSGSGYKGVPIYWLNGNKAADDYEDFYNETSWDEEASMRTEAGTSIEAPTNIWTGSGHDGTEARTSNNASRALGNNDVATGWPDHSTSGLGPLGSDQAWSSDKNISHEFYGLSGVFRVVANFPATGKPVITGTPEVNKTLTADISGIMDADGLPAADQFSYRWVRNDGAADSDISGATDSTYKLKAADLGQTIKVKVTFTDESGIQETLTSDATAAVAEDTTGPVIKEVICFDSYCNLAFDELLDVYHLPPNNAFAITADGASITVGFVVSVGTGVARLGSLVPQIRQGQTVKVVYTDPTVGDDTNAIQDEAGNDAATFTTGEDDIPAVTNDSTVARVAPGAPTDLTATANGATQIDLTWTAPADNGGHAITGYQIEYSDDGGTTWNVLVADTQSTDTMYSDTTLSGGETRHYRVSAINSIGTGAASNNPRHGQTRHHRHAGGE